MIHFDLTSKNLGIELTTKHLKGALISQRRSSLSVVKLFESPLEPNVQKSPSKATESSFSSVKKQTIVACAMPTQEVLVRSLEIKLKKEKDIDAVLAFQAEPLLPFPLESAVIDKISVGSTEEGTLLSLLAVRKDRLQAHLDLLQACGIEPEVVTAAPLALVSYSAFVLPEKQPHFILHIGKEHMCCVYAKEGKLIASQASTQNLLGLLACFSAQAPAQSLKDMQIKEVTDNPKAMETIELLQKEISRLLLSLMKQAKELKVPDVLLTGDLESMGPLKDLILKKLNIKLLTPEQPAGTKIPLEQLHGHAIAIGSALLNYEKGSLKVNFRQAEFAYPHPWKHWKKPLIAYFGACALLLLSFMAFQLAYIESKTDTLRIEYSKLLAHLNKPYESFEKEFAKSTGPDSSQIRPLISLSAEEIQQRLFTVNKELQAIPDLFPLHPNVPRVSDVLAWLTSHPKTLSKDPKTEQEQPLIHIESFSYAMVKRPDLVKKREKYQVRVDIEFTSLNPTVAREFHDALLAPNPFVDPKVELKWIHNKGKYKAIFFLKDRTIYP